MILICFIAAAFNVYAASEGAMPVTNWLCALLCVAAGLYNLDRE